MFLTNFTLYVYFFYVPEEQQIGDKKDNKVETVSITVS